jgi:hypothetical protein
MHSSEVTQSEVDVHYLVLVLIYLATIRHEHSGPIFFHGVFCPLPKLGLELQDIGVRREVSDFHSEISCSELLLV